MNKPWRDSTLKNPAAAHPDNYYGKRQKRDHPKPIISYYQNAKATDSIC